MYLRNHYFIANQSSLLQIRIVYFIKIFYLCIVLIDKVFLPIHKEDLINSTPYINNSPLSFSEFIHIN